MSTLVNEGEGGDQGLFNVDKFKLFIRLDNSNKEKLNIFNMVLVCWTLGRKNFFNKIFINSAEKP